MMRMHVKKGGAEKRKRLLKLERAKNQVEYKREERIRKCKIFLFPENYFFL